MTISFPSQGVFSKLLIEDGVAPYTWNATAMRFEIVPSPAETFQKHSRLIEARGITGKLYPLKSRTRFGPALVYGSLRMNPSPGDMNRLLKYLMGPSVGGVFYPSICLQSFGAMLTRDLDVWEYQNGVVNAWELTGSVPKENDESSSPLLTLTISCIFLQEVSPLAVVPPVWPDPEPALPSGTQYAPLSLRDSEASFTMSGDTREIYKFRLKYDNGLDPTLIDSFDLQSVTAPGRRVDLDVILPWQSDIQDMYDEEISGAAARLKFSYNDGDSTHGVQFDISNLKQDSASSPTAEGFADVSFEVSGRAYGTVTSPEISAIVT